MPAATVQEFFDTLPSHFDAGAADGFSAVYQFDLRDPHGGQYVVMIADGGCSVSRGTHSDPQVTFEMTGEDCLGVLTGRLDAHAVLMSGRIRVIGDLTLAALLKTFFPTVEKHRR